MNTARRTTSSLTLLVIFTLTLSLAPVSARVVGNGASAESTEGSGGGARLEGTWLLEVTVRNCETGDPIRSFPSLVTYTRGGTLIAVTSSTPPTTQYPGLGVWRHTEGSSYTATYMIFRFNPDGSFAGTQRVYQDIQLSSDGSELSTTATFEVINPAGVVVASGCATNVGTRFGFA